MRSLPDLTNVDAMAARGRRSCLMSARNEACEQLRDACTQIMRVDVLSLDSADFERAEEALKRLRQLAKLWSAEE